MQAPCRRVGAKATKAPYAGVDFVSFAAPSTRSGQAKATKDTHAHAQNVAFVASRAVCGSRRFQTAKSKLARRDKVGQRYYVEM